MSTSQPVAAESSTPDKGSRPERGRRRKLVRFVTVAAVVIATASAIAGAVLWRGGQAEADGGDNQRSTALADVTRQTLTSQVTVDGILGYAGDYRAVNHVPGIVTSLPEEGDVIEPGEIIYAVDGSPVILLEGSAPAYRSLAEGMSGPDVAQLNAALVALGYATSSDLDPESDEFAAATAEALKQLQAALGIEETGALELGQAVFLPGPARITSVDATLGAPAQPGATALRTTSTTPVVAIDLSPALQSQVDVGDAVTVTLPDRQTTEGTVSSIGSVATAPDSSGTSGSGGGRPTISVEVELANPDAAGTLDQAPVSVSITTAVVEDALVVPVTALVALAGGGHAVEVAHADGTRELLPVTTGLFDSSRGLVEVSADGLEAGQQVVVPGR